MLGSNAGGNICNVSKYGSSGNAGILVIYIRGVFRGVSEVSGNQSIE